jgi:hypothetical protein
LEEDIYSVGVTVRQMVVTAMPWHNKVTTIKDFKQYKDLHSDLTSIRKEWPKATREFLEMCFQEDERKSADDILATASLFSTERLRRYNATEEHLVVGKSSRGGGGRRLSHIGSGGGGGGGDYPPDTTDVKQDTLSRENALAWTQIRPVPRCDGL